MKTLKIAIDLHGGDDAPQIVFGALKLALKERFVLPEQLVAIGTEDAIQQMQKPHKLRGIECLKCTEIVDMGEKGLSAFRKRDSSINLGIGGIKVKRFNGFVSAGNTAVVVGTSVAVLGRSKEKLKPAIAVPLPNQTTSCLLLDAGAIAECGLDDYLHLALMGKIYAQKVWGITDPKVGLLNIGDESGKGSQLLQEAHKLLTNAAQGGMINFEVGSIESDKILKADVNVVVCSGTLGNLVLKFGEAMAEMIFSQLGQTWKAAQLRNLLIRHADYQKIGAAPLLGVNGNIYIAHGKSTPMALAHAIRTAVIGTQSDFSAAIAKEINND